MSDQLDEQLSQLMKEATEARHAIPQGDIDDGPHELHAQLLKARQATDKIEDILVRIQGALKSARLTERAAQQDVEDAEAAYVSKPKVSLSGDYATGKEKNAELLLATTDQRIVLRKAERQSTLLRDVLDYVRTLHSGANSARRDIDLRVRLIILQSQLEK